MDVTTNAPDPQAFEQACCLLCDSTACTSLLEAEDDLTGKPGRFQFVTCDLCGFAYQNPRLKFEHIGSYYDDEYIAHRKKTDWGLFTPLYEWAMGKHDRDKLALVQRYSHLQSESRILDIGCGAGTFLELAHEQTRAHVTGTDFKDLSALPSMHTVDFHHGLLHELNLTSHPYDLITMWHFLEHDYTVLRTLASCQKLLSDSGRLVIEVPRLDSVSFSLFKERWPGLQAPQHTALFTRETLLQTVDKAGFRVVDYLPYGAFPPYFYLFTGLAFKILRGRGLNLSRAIYPYFLGQALSFPVLLFQRRLNLAMQTVICERR